MHYCTLCNARPNAFQRSKSKLIYYQVFLVGHSKPFDRHRNRHRHRLFLSIHSIFYSISNVFLTLFACSFVQRLAFNYVVLVCTCTQWPHLHPGPFSINHESVGQCVCSKFFQRSTANRSNSTGANLHSSQSSQLINQFFFVNDRIISEMSSKQFWLHLLFVFHVRPITIFVFSLFFSNLAFAAYDSPPLYFTPTLPVVETRDSAVFREFSPFSALDRTIPL